MDVRDLQHLPGSELLLQGIDDLNSGQLTVPGLLLLSAATRLRAYGIAIPQVDLKGEPAAHLFYELLCKENGKSAYSLYNSYRRRLVSLLRVLGSFKG
jgi:hypothetical protein